MSKWMLRITQMVDQFGNFLTWWKEGLLLWLPNAIREKYFTVTQGLNVVVDEEGFTFFTNQGKKDAPLAKYPFPLQDEQKQEIHNLVANYSHNYLVLPKSVVLYHELSLPSATQKKLHNVIGFEVDRLTPYTTKEVYFDAKIQGRSNENRNILVAVYIVPKQILENILARAEILKIRFDGAKQENSSVVLNVLPKINHNHLNKTEKHRRLLWLCSAVALFAALLLPTLYLRQVAVKLEKEVAVLQPQAIALSEREGNLLSLLTANQYLAKEKSETVPVLIISNELSRLMPEDSYLESLNLIANKVTIRGVAKQASSLSALLATSPYFSSISQISPITSDGRGNERFGFSIDVSKVEQEGENNE